MKLIGDFQDIANIYSKTIILRLRELIKSMTDGSLSLVTVLNKCQKEVKESLRASSNTFTFNGKATIEKTAIPAEVKNILSEKLSKFVQVEMQRIVPLLTTDDVLKQSAPHGQEYYQEWLRIIRSSSIDFNLTFFHNLLKG